MPSITDSPAVKQRAAASNVALSFGDVLTMTLDWVPSAVPNKDKDATFHQLCTVCTDPTRLRQKMVCSVDEGHVQDPDKPRKGKELPDKTLVAVTPEEVAAVKGTADDADDDGPKEMALVSVRAATVMEHTLPGDVVYRLRPNKKTTAKGSYDLLRVLVTQALRSGKVLIGDLAIRETPRMFWLAIRHDQVIAQALMRPDDIAPFDEIAKGDVGEKVPQLAAQLIEQLTVDFDPAEWGNQQRKRAKDLIAAKAANPDATPVASITPITKPKGEIDLEQLLGSMIAS